MRHRGRAHGRHPGRRPGDRRGAGRRSDVPSGRSFLSARIPRPIRRPGCPSGVPSGTSCGTMPPNARIRACDRGEGVPLAVLNSPTVRAWHAGWGVRYRRGTQLRACARSIMRPGSSVPPRYSNPPNVRGRHAEGGIGYRRSTRLAERARSGMRSGNQGHCHRLHDRVPRPWFAPDPGFRGTGRRDSGRRQRERRLLQKSQIDRYDRCSSGAAERRTVPLEEAAVMIPRIRPAIVRLAPLLTVVMVAGACAPSPDADPPPPAPEAPPERDPGAFPEVPPEEPEPLVEEEVPEPAEPREALRAELAGITDPDAMLAATTTISTVLPAPPGAHGGADRPADAPPGIPDRDHGGGARESSHH